MLRKKVYFLQCSAYCGTAHFLLFSSPPQFFLPQKMEETKNEDFTSVLISPASKAMLRGNKKDSALVSDADDSTKTSAKTNKHSKKPRWTFRSMFVCIAACCLLGLYCLNSIYNQLSPISGTCAEEWEISIDYPVSFPRTRELLVLRRSIRFLARSYGEDIMGKCYRPQTLLNDFLVFSRIPELSSTFSNNGRPFPTPQPSANYSGAQAPYSETKSFSSLPPSPSSAFLSPFNHSGAPMPTFSAAHDSMVVGSTKTRGYVATPSSSTTFSNRYGYIDFSPLAVDYAQNISVPGGSIRGLAIQVDDDIDVSVHILTASQAGLDSTEMLHIYLKPSYTSYDGHYDNNSDNDDDDDDDNGFRDAGLQLYGGYGRYSLWLRSTTFHHVKCSLRIILPDIYSSTNETSASFTNGNGGLQHFMFHAKAGNVYAKDLNFLRFTATVGRGTVNLTSIDTENMRIAILDGHIDLRGIKVKRSLASGVVRGSSTVLAKIHPELNNNTYTLVNMCADGYTYTDVMTTEEDHDKFAANLHVYRETGTRALDELEPMIKLKGDTYYADPSLALLHPNSTDVYKTGYMIAPNTDSKILVYTGAKSDASRAMKSRFLYGYYYENQQ
ncbi:hypothetical protein BDB00DRAFT_794669 [Zychaea mexicana]|uniref:uncharacterized protein n=1 Tax=Zychaea mexicana TaxID=64656 RepID=UPI0022FEB115|nr:uncharacterized protein BDB00DRAFT_794669 [Zychaea mexicana]KAI9499605.1 hypothetical protein BDB00DRAFT_794669 [Zychaea mexicana]